MIALVVACDREVGVDVEDIRPRRSLDAIASQQFHPHERKNLEAAEGADKLSEFYRIWTCKEAYLKGLGHGFAMPLTSFAMLPQALQAVRTYTPQPALDEQAWRVLSQVEPEVALAVAAPGMWEIEFCG